MSNSKKKVAPTDIPAEIQTIIEQAVKKGIEAGKKLAKKEQQGKFNAFQSTEERLYAMPTLIKKVADDKEMLEELGDHGQKRRSKDICRFQANGVRLSDDDIVDTLIQDLKAKIARDEYEIQTIHTALKLVEDDFYYPALKGKYFTHESDKQLAEALHCDETTVWRNRSRLVRVVAVRLYGVEALRREE